ncbi:NADH:ubiquinone oxidoreductase 14kD subunit [Metarhizium acridum CQMa 102]|uniref:NADH dehydrogenase [ubiquinone] 1 alpha subcomplex subunit 13 n=5 Tax=Opisthokonta TaxID=33154 RepID=E9EAW5_METAQ|nr:NADH:ubiquinone oxidoreductase 14kD subunit [Metarhizium acridum CQMa 102]EFY86999.1 NADH:ubiquinone oxidoreductase 14kD subunit [Metarhizium acridum CQMa 102]
MGVATPHYFFIYGITFRDRCFRVVQLTSVVISLDRFPTYAFATMAQDMPPRGGYEPVQYKRNLPAKGFRPGILLLGVGAVMGFGWYKLIGGIREANELAREKMWARINLIPLLQAEEDRDQVRRYWADQKREKELLGENTKVYNNESRFVRPTFAVSPAPSK